MANIAESFPRPPPTITTTVSVTQRACKSAYDTQWEERRTIQESTKANQHQINQLLFWKLIKDQSDGNIQQAILRLYWNIFMTATVNLIHQKANDFIKPTLNQYTRMLI